MKRKITEISIYEFFICLFVIAIHIMSEGVAQFQHWSIPSVVFVSITKLISFAVPGFVFTSAVKIFYNYGDRRFNYFKFLYGRFLKVCVPYIIAVIIYYFVFVFVLRLDGYETFSFKALLDAILTGNISAQFYFVILILQFYILMPLWVLLEKIKSNIWVIVLFFTALVITILSRMYFFKVTSSLISGLGTINVSGNPLSALNPTDFVSQINNFTNECFTSYLVYWICGMYIGLHYDEFTDIIENAKPVLYVGWFLLAVTHCILSYLKLCGEITYSLEPIIVTLFCFFSIFGFYTYVNNHTKSLKRKGRGFLSSIANASYDIYLIHCLVIIVVQACLTYAEIENIMLRFVITAVVTYVFSILFSVMEATIQTNIRLKYRRKSAAKARKLARRERYL